MKLPIPLPPGPPMNQYCEFCTCMHCNAKRRVHTELYGLLPNEVVFKLAFDTELSKRVLEVLKKAHEG